MEFKNLCGNNVSLLGFGCMRPPIEGGKYDLELFERMFDYAIDEGVNYFDTAYVYLGGKSEEFLGKVLTKYKDKRSKLYVATKMPAYAASQHEDIR